MNSVEIQISDKYPDLKCKLDFEWYQMIIIDGGCKINLCKGGSCKQGSAGVYNNTSKGRILEWIHTLITNRKGMNKIDKLVIDHKNGDQLDNRSENLRVVSYSENSMNRTNKLKSTNKTGTRGLAIHKGRNGKQYYVVNLHIDKIRVFNKYYTSFEDAKAVAEFHDLIMS